MAVNNIQSHLNSLILMTTNINICDLILRNKFQCIQTMLMLANDGGIPTLICFCFEVFMKKN